MLQRSTDQKTGRLLSRALRRLGIIEVLAAQPANDSVPVVVNITIETALIANDRLYVERFKESMMTMGDSFHNVSDSTIVNRSSLLNSMNSLRDRMGEDAASALKELNQVVTESENHDAVEIFNELTAELERPKPKKVLLRSLWSSLVAILPAAAQAVEISKGLSELLGP